VSLNGTLKCNCTEGFVGPHCENQIPTQCVDTCNATLGDPNLFKFPYTLVMDTTQSQQPYSQVIKGVIQSLNLAKAEVYQLVEFNDAPDYLDGDHPDYLDDDYTRTYPQTTDRSVFLSQVQGLAFGNGGDAPEQMFQGLLNACQVSKDKAIITVTLDSGTHKKELAPMIEDCLKRKNATLIICFNPNFLEPENPDNAGSLPLYEQLAQATGGKVLNTFNLDPTLETIVSNLEKEYIEVIWNLCNCTTIKPKAGRVPLYRYWGSNDHFYTTDADEIGTTTYGEIGHYNYKSEGVACMVLATGNAKGSVPLYRYWKEHGSDHLYTTNPNEIGTTTPGKIGNDGYKFEGIAGYCFSTRVAGTVPFYRYWKRSVTDHFYTTNWAVLGKGKDGWQFEGVECYVFPRIVSG